MDAIQAFLTEYWNVMQWYLIGAAALTLVTWLLLRRPGKAFALLLLVVYVTLAAHFLNVREGLGFTPVTALAVLIVSGLAVGVILYFFVFVRTQ
jgi:hypothetical protein